MSLRLLQFPNRAEAGGSANRTNSIESRRESSADRVYPSESKRFRKMRFSLRIWPSNVVVLAISSLISSRLAHLPRLFTAVA